MTKCILIGFKRSPVTEHNPLVPSAHKSARIAQNSILKLEIKKLSYERRVYESVDEKSLP